MSFDLVTILGPTASGKTKLAAQLAFSLGAEIISADSRQVYRRMNIGTGKDLEDYFVDGHEISKHLIDIVEPGTKYNLFEFRRDFLKAFNDIQRKGHLPILCGGSGLYMESVLRAYDLPEVPENKELRAELSNKSLAELTTILQSFKTLHNSTDIDTHKRAVRAIEIEEWKINNPEKSLPFPNIKSIVFGIDISREKRRQRISERLKSRLDNGLIDEVRALMSEGISPDDLIYYGLEYKYVTLYVIGKIDYQEMFNKLEVSIHQFAKRQMTWFRGMERRGTTIHWIPFELSLEDKVKVIVEILNNY